jgi:hypothetical protein
MGQALGQVDAVGPDPGRERGVLTDQQRQAPGAGDGLEPPRGGLGVRGPEVAVDDGAAGRERAGRSPRGRASAPGL